MANRNSADPERLQRAIALLVDLGFPHVEISPLATTGSVALAGRWARGRSSTELINVERLEFAFKLAKQLDAIKPGYGRTFFATPVTGDKKVTPSYLLATSDRGNWSIIEGLANDFPSRFKTENIRLKGPRKTPDPAKPVPEDDKGARVPEVAMRLRAAGFTVNHFCRLVNLNGSHHTDWPSVSITLRVQWKDFASRLAHAERIFQGHRRLYGEQIARELMFWDAPGLGLRGRSLADAIRQLPAQERFWRREHLQPIQAAADWLADPRNARRLPRGTARRGRANQAA